MESKKYEVTVLEKKGTCDNSLFEKMAKKAVNIRLANVQQKNDVCMSVNKMIFLMKIASVPEKISARNLYKVALLYKNLPLTSINVPRMIKNIPMISCMPGISLSNNIPQNSAIIGL